MIDFRPMLFFAGIYIGLGTSGGKLIDFFYVEIPKPWRKLYYVTVVRRLSSVSCKESNKLPINVVIVQTISLVNFALWLITTLYSTIFGVNISRIYAVCFFISFFILLLIVVYVCVCDLYFRNK